MVEFRDPGLTESIARDIGAPPPFRKETLEQIDLLIVERARSLEGICTLKNLKKLSVVKTPLKTLSFLQQCRQLKRLTVRESLLEDISETRLLSVCNTFEFIRSRVRDLTPLLDAESGMIFNLRGNPLSDESYRDILPRLEEGALEVTFDTEDIWQLNRRLDEQGVPAAFSAHHEDGHRLVPLTDDLQFDQKEFVYAVISPNELAAELDKSEIDLAGLIERYRPQPNAKTTVWDTREFGGVDEVRGWVQGAKLDSDLEASLSSFVGRFEDATFVRESDELLEDFAWSRGPARHEVNWMKIEFPDWLKTWRKTLAWAEADAQLSCFMVADPKLPASLEHHGALAFTVRPFGRNNSDFAQALINRHHAYPIGYAGPNSQFALAVDLRNSTDDTIYIFRTDEVYRWDFSPFEHRLFEGVAAMFDAVDELGDADGCAASELGDTPPKVEFELDAHLDSGDAKQAKGWIAQAGLPERLAAALANFADGFPQLTFVRDTEASLQYYEVLNGAKLPEWYRHVRKTLGFAQSDGRPVELLFGGWTSMQNEPFRFGPGQIYYDMGRKLIDEYDQYPVLASPQYFLSINLNERDDQVVYWCDVDEVDRRALSKTPKFSSLAELFDEVTALQISGETIERD